ncbi:MAG: hypothetical protein MUP21_04995 [Dehalococcoidia bacterium]|nr:hypothetical protein [Dehalococcoidia bacterium]
MSIQSTRVQQERVGGCLQIQDVMDNDWLSTANSQISDNHVITPASTWKILKKEGSPESKAPVSYIKEALRAAANLDPDITIG